MATFIPTIEQEKARDLFMTGESLTINAFAGSGKTATLQFLAKETRNAGLYLAFNRSLAIEAQTKFPSNISCRTCHSLAYQSTPQALRNNRKKMLGAMNSNRLAQLYSLDSLKLSSEFNVSSRYRASLILETLRKFMQSADAEISVQHFKVKGRLECATDDQLDLIRNDTIENAKKLWREMIDPSCLNVPLGHDGYFKLWALSNPNLGADYVLLDEAQDTAPVMLGVLKEQSCQVVLVGDKYQQIYEWRGAVNAMENFTTKQITCLTQSFRFGNTIASAASKLLKILGEEKSIHGNPQINSHIVLTTEPDAILCRTNEGVLDKAMKSLIDGLTPYILGGSGEITRLLTAVKGLKAGEESVGVPELYGFESWSQVTEFSKREEGASLRSLVRIVERFGEDRLLEGLNKMNSTEKEADVVISTIHKAKGRQWDKVVMADDFAIADSNDELNKTEIQLIYVGLTRAREEARIPFSVRSICRVEQETIKNISHAA